MKVTPGQRALSAEDEPNARLAMQFLMGHLTPGLLLNLIHTNEPLWPTIPAGRRAMIAAAARANSDALERLGFEEAKEALLLTRPDLCATCSFGDWVWFRAQIWDLRGRLLTS